jgi:uncharacterized protein (DUF302 family)
MKKLLTKKSSLAFFLCGFLWGIAATYVGIGLFLRNFLILEYPARFSVKETSETLAKQAVNSKGWTVKRASCALPKPSDNSTIESIALCNAKIAKAIVDDPESRPVTSIIPCQFSVYQNQDGKVMIARLNVGLLSILTGHSSAGKNLMNAMKEQKIILNEIRAK